MNKELDKKLKQLKTEDFIWIIYLVIILLSWYSNNLERKYFIFDDLIAKAKYQNIMIFIFTVLFIIYLYFFYDAFKSVTELKKDDSKSKKDLILLAFYSSFLLTISGALFLYIAIKNKNLDVELAFN